MRQTGPAAAILSLAAMVAIVFALPVKAAPTRLSAAQARRLLSALASRYAAASSYSAVAVVRLHFAQPLPAKDQPNPARFLVTLVAQRPNRMRIHVQAGPASAPVVDRLFVSDGASLVYRDAVQGVTHRLGRAPSTLAAMIPELQRYMSVAAQLDPLYFLTHTTLPPWLQISSGSQDGSAVRIFGSSPSRPSHYKTAGGQNVSLPAMYWEWTIDVAGKRLTRVSASLQPLARGKKSLLAPVTGLIEMIAPARLNEPIAASLFTLPGHTPAALHRPPVRSR